MPKKFKKPRSRLEEIMRARKLRQIDLAALTALQTSNLSRVVTGEREISPGLRPVLARALEVSEGTLYDPIGALIPPTPEAAPPAPDDLVKGVAPGFEERWHAAAAMPELERLVGLLYFLVSGKRDEDDTT